MEADKLRNQTDSTLTKVFFELDTNDWHGNESESLWAEPVSSNRYRLRNTPFFAKDVSFEDVVFARQQAGNLIFESISIAAGHSTYRILLEKNLPNAEFSKYWNPLEALGCSYESADRTKTLMLAVDVPPSVNIYEVYSLLEKGEKDGVWSFEEGHCGHAL